MSNYHKINQLSLTNIVSGCESQASFIYFRYMLRSREYQQCSLSWIRQSCSSHPASAFSSISCESKVTFLRSHQYLQCSIFRTLIQYKYIFHLSSLYLSTTFYISVSCLWFTPGWNPVLAIFKSNV